jgi:hypothetical protein
MFNHRLFFSLEEKGQRLYVKGKGHSKNHWKKDIDAIMNFSGLEIEHCPNPLQNHILHHPRLHDKQQKILLHSNDLLSFH